MKILKRGPDFIKFRISSEDDLWTTAKLCKKNRRMGVCLAKGKTIEEARQKADRSASFVKVIQG